jgi:hypothetical protein
VLHEDVHKTRLYAELGNRSRNGVGDVARAASGGGDFEEGLMGSHERIFRLAASALFEQSRTRPLAPICDCGKISFPYAAIAAATTATGGFFRRFAEFDASL